MNYDKLPPDTAQLIYEHAVGYVKDSIDCSDAIDRKALTLLSIIFLILGASAAYKIPLTPINVAVIAFFSLDIILLVWITRPRLYNPAYFETYKLMALQDERLQSRKILMCGLLDWYNDATKENKELVASKSRELFCAKIIFLIGLFCGLMAVLSA